jgi:hypothetical protein
MKRICFLAFFSLTLLAIRASASTISSTISDGCPQESFGELGQFACQSSNYGGFGSAAYVELRGPAAPASEQVSATYLFEVTSASEPVYVRACLTATVDSGGLGTGTAQASWGGGSLDFDAFSGSVASPQSTCPTLGYSSGPPSPAEFVPVGVVIPVSFSLSATGFILNQPNSDNYTGGGYATLYRPGVSRRSGESAYGCDLYAGARRRT